MTTCKDCVHFEACKNIYEIYGDGLSEESYSCDQFSNRSRFVELPCKIGDIVYFGYYLPTIRQNKIDEWIVGKISFLNYHLGNFFDSDGKWAVGDKENRIAITLVLSDKSEFSPDSIDVSLKDFKDMFFTSREAAEQALKEREERV